MVSTRTTEYFNNNFFVGEVTVVNGLKYNRNEHVDWWGLDFYFF